MIAIEAPSDATPGTVVCATISGSIDIEVTITGPPEGVPFTIEGMGPNSFKVTFVMPRDDVLIEAGTDGRLTDAVVFAR